MSLGRCALIFDIFPLKSTISTFLKNEEIKTANVAKGSNVISKQRIKIIEEVDKLLLVFINEKQLKGGSLSETFICEKAQDINGDPVKKLFMQILKTLTSKQEEDGSKSLKRCGIHSVFRHGEAASTKKKEAKKFKKEFSDLIKAESFVPQQVETKQVYFEKRCQIALS